MVKIKSSALSYQEKLQIIEKWSVRFAQSIVGGVPTPPNDPYGDLRHEDGSYTEVKSGGVTSGAIIRRKQLRAHCAGPTDNYVIVFREVRIRQGKGYLYTTLLHGTSRKALEDHLLATVREVCIIHKTGIEAIYKKRRSRRERTYHFKAGPKTYIKVYRGDFVPLVLRGFQLGGRCRTVRFEGKEVGFSETRVPART